MFAAAAAFLYDVSLLLVFWCCGILEVTLLAMYFCQRVKPKISSEVSEP